MSFIEPFIDQLDSCVYYRLLVWIFPDQTTIDRPFMRSNNGMPPPPVTEYATLPESRFHGDELSLFEINTHRNCWILWYLETKL